MALVLTLNRMADDANGVMNELTQFALGGDNLQLDGVLLSLLMLSEDKANAASLSADLTEVREAVFALAPAQKALTLIKQFSAGFEAFKANGDKGDLSGNVCIVSEDDGQASGFEVLFK